MTAQVVPLPRKAPHPGDLIKVIRKLVEKGAFGFSYHAFDVRGVERAIDIQDALAVLRQGIIKGDVVPGKGAGEWKCKVVDKLDDTFRWLGVVTVVIKNERLFVLTVEWEDQ
jgi:hypothetical protein